MSIDSYGHQVQLSVDMTGGDIGGENGLCLLSLDGGGVRGLSSLYILRRIMVKMNAERQKKGEHDAKPCNVFDLIGGTSTGGLIAILLGRLEMSVDECLAVFKDWMREIFEQHRDHLAKFKQLNGQLQHRFSPDNMKKAILKALALKNIPTDELYDNGQERTCRTFVVARRVESNSHVLIRDYTMPGEENYDKLTIVEAALATSAASTFFPPLEAGGKRYVDGALGDNNPTPLVYQLAQDIWARDDGRLNDRLKCLISIGTGKPSFSGVESSARAFLSKTLKNIVTETEETERKFAKANRGLFNKSEEQVYFRFNVESGLEGIGLQEHEKADLIEVATFDYLEHSQPRKFELDRCARRIGEKKKPDNERTKRPSVPKFSNVPRKHRYFVGRDRDLDTLRRRLSPCTNTEEAKPKSCLIHGMGGMGKTQLSRAYSDASSYDFHFWVQAESVAKLADSFQAIANALGLPQLQSGSDLVETVKSALEEQDSSWLLIFDNVEDSSFNEAVEAMPNKARKASAIVVTSQLEDLKHHTQSIIHLGSLGTQEGADLILKCLQRDPATVSHRDHELLLEISTKLGGLPLALAHTGGYMSKSKEALSEFIDFFKDRWEHAVYETLQERVHQYNNQALTVVWDFALEKLEPNQRKLINILAYLNADDIEKEWLVQERRLSRGWVDNGLNAKSHIHDLMTSLNERCLIETKTTASSHGSRSSYSIHRSLQIALRLKLDQDQNERMVVLGHAISIMRRVTPRANDLQVPNRKYWPAFAKASPHVFSMCLAFKAAYPAIVGGTEELARLFYDTGFHYWERWSAVPRNGINLLLTAESILDQLKYDGPRLRSDISCMVSCLLDLVGAGYMDGIEVEARTEALRRREELVRMRKEVMLDESSKSKSELPKTMRSVKLATGEGSVDEILYYNGVNDLGLSYLQVNQFEEAESLFEECYAKYRTWGKVDEIPFEYGKYFHNISFVRMYQGRYDEAISWAEKALACKVKADKTSSTPRYLWIQYNMANIMVQAGRLAEALDLHFTILRNRETICGSRSEQVLQSLYTIGAIYYHLGQFGQAEANFRECLERARKSRWTTAHALERAQWHLAKTLKQQNKDLAYAERLEDVSRIELNRIVEILEEDPPDYMVHMPEDLETHGISLFDWALPCYGNRWTGRNLLRVIQTAHGITPQESTS